MEKRKPNFESTSKGLSAWINTARNSDREYLVIVDKDGNKQYLNKV